MPDLKIEIGANIGNTEQQLKKVEKGLTGVSDSAKKADASLKRVGTGGAADATNALTNLGRVVQDAPFGFIGIANNINPLIESFQRLKKESGSTGSAIKSLVAGLAGGGGLGLAISLGSAALSLFGLAMNKSGKEAKVAAEKVDEYGKTVQGISQKVADQVGQVEVLTKAYERQNLTQGQRVSIIEKLKQIAPEYFNQLKSEKTSIDELTVAYTAFAKSIDKTILAELQRARLKTLLERRVQLTVDLNLEEADTKLDALFDNVPKGAQKAIDATNNIFKKDPFKKAKAPLEIENSAITEYKDKLSELNKITKEAFDIEVDLAKGLVVKEPDADKAKKVKEAIVKGLKFGPDDWEKMFFDEATIKLAVPAQVELDFKKSLNAGGKSADDSLLGGILGPAALTEAQLKANLLGLGISKGIQDGLEVGLDGLRSPELKALEESAQKKATEFRGFMTALYSEAVIGAFEELGESIGEALAGATDPIGSFFGGIAELLAKSLKDLGKFVISTSTIVASLKKALNAAFAGNPALGIIAGVALIAIGSALEKAIPKFADGVTNFGGGLALVGERGPELVRLPKGSDVIPNHQLGGISGNTNVFIPDVKIRGNDLVLVFNRASATIGRNG